MSRRRANRPRSTTSPLVHFTFRSHPEGEYYLPDSNPHQFKATVFEASSGAFGFGKKGSFTPTTSKGTTLFEKTAHDYLVRAGRSGSRVIAGESSGYSPVGLFRLMRLRWNHKKLQSLENRMMVTPTVSNIRRYIITLSNTNRIRHAMIVATIQMLVKRGEVPINVRYGTDHSLLSRDLARAGIASDRRVSREKMDYFSIVTRQLTANKNSKITLTLYKKAFFSYIFNDEMIRGLPSQLRVTDDIVEGICAINRRIADTLSEKQIENCIKKYASGKNWFSQVLSDCGFANVPSYSNLKAWASV